MVKKFLKFIEKSPHKELFLRVLQDISDDNLSHYDIKPLTGQKGYYRIRVGTIRFIYKKTATGNLIVDINNRGDIY